MNSNKLYYTMDTIFMNSENSEISDPHRLLLNLLDKRDLKRNDEHIAYKILAYAMHGKI